MDALDLLDLYFLNTTKIFKKYIKIAFSTIVIIFAIFSSQPKFKKMSKRICCTISPTPWTKRVEASLLSKWSFVLNTKDLHKKKATRIPIIYDIILAIDLSIMKASTFSNTISTNVPMPQNRMNKRFPFRPSFILCLFLWKLL